jgi:peptidoglycan/LPS O-acetylase OafA/YrhL
MQNKLPRPYFPHLDGLRFFAFLIVFISHSVLFLWNGDLYLAQGDLGVNFFFVLSGFLITYFLYYEKEVTRGFINIKKFYAKKILRIWPVLFVVLMLAFILGNIGLENLPFAIDLKFADIPWFLSFLSNFYIINGQVSAAIAILWAISVEVQFYIFWPIIVSWVKKKYVPALLLAIIILTTVFRFIHSDEPNQVLYSTFSVSSGIAIGSLFGFFAFFKKDFAEKMSAFFTRKKVILLYVVFLISIWVKMFPSNFIPQTLMSFYTAILPLIFSLLFIFIILEQNYSASSLFKSSTNKSVAYLGKISYGLYAYHMLCIAVIFSLFKSMGINSGLVISLVSFSFTILISHISYKYFESKILKYKNLAK